MKRKTNLTTNFNIAVGALAAFLLCLVPAKAQSNRTFVSTAGADSATCGSFTSPCRSFNVALPNTNPGGQVTALDSGLYDSFNIGISIAVTLTAAPGVHAEVPGITVNTTVNDTVILRNLYVSKQPGDATDGIAVTRVGALHVENCVVTGFSIGISFTLTAAAEVFIADTVVRNSQASGISISTSAGLIKATINRCRIENNGHSGPTGDGVAVGRRTRVTVRDTVAAGNSGAGFVVTAGEMILENCEASNNADGVISSGTETLSGLAIASKTIATNNTRDGFRQEGTGVFNSLGDNVVRRNGTNTFGTIGVISGT